MLGYNNSDSIIDKIFWCSFFFNAPKKY